MNQVGIFLSIIAIIVVALDVLVRLVIVPNRRDKFLEDVLDTMTDPEAEPQDESVPKASIELDASLVESIIRYFELSATSRHVLAALALRVDGMSESEILASVNRRLERQRRRELPAPVVRKVVSLLMRAELATLGQGKLEITDAGRNLHTIIQARSSDRKPALALASP